MPWLLGILLAIGGGIALAVKHKNAPHPAAPTAHGTLGERVAAAVAKKDYKALDALAAESASHGLTTAAESQRAEADRLRAVAGVPTVHLHMPGAHERAIAASAPLAQKVSDVLPPAPTPSPGPPGLGVAQAFDRYLRDLGGLKGRGHENADKVKSFQRQLGATTIDGRYGRGDAKLLMQRGVVPVVPFYWPRTDVAKAKRDFRAVVEQYRAADPVRDNDWRALLADIERA